MANLRLKKLILEIVDNQLRDNNPPVTRESYDKLLAAGYSVQEAKEKIGAVVIEEIYDVLKENQVYDEEKYSEALEHMVQQCIDYEDAHKILTEWDEWDQLMDAGYEALNEQDLERMTLLWWEAWGVFQKIVEKEEHKTSISELVESQDYQYPADEWLKDMEIYLANAGEHRKRREFCERVLEILDWSLDDSSGFKCAIGEELYAEGNVEQGRCWFEDWLKEEPYNQNALSAFSWCVQEEKGSEEAYKLIRGRVIGATCTSENDILFDHARLLAKELNKKEDLEWIETQREKYYNEWDEADLYNDVFDDFVLPAQNPIVKEKKIYPNDPCPCGSGKKYKKCCGKRL